MTNRAETPSDFVRVLLSAAGQDQESAVAHVAGCHGHKHSMVRVSRTNVPPGLKTRVEAAGFRCFDRLVPGKTEWKIAARDGYRFLDKGTTENSKRPATCRCSS